MAIHQTKFRCIALGGKTVALFYKSPLILDQLLKNYSLLDPSANKSDVLNGRGFVYL